MSDDCDPAYDKVMSARNTKGRAMIAKSYAKGGEVSRGVHEHEDHMHHGKKKTKIHLKSGGEAKGEHGKHKLDKYAGGGKVKAKKGVTVNVMVAPSQPQPPQKVPVPVPAGGGAGVPPRPPMPPPQGGGMPPPGMHPPMARGGSVKYKVPKLPGGSGGGEGRLAKAKEYGGR